MRIKHAKLLSEWWLNWDMCGWDDNVVIFRWECRSHATLQTHGGLIVVGPPPPCNGFSHNHNISMYVYMLRKEEKRPKQAAAAQVTETVICITRFAAAHDVSFRLLISLFFFSSLAPSCLFVRFDFCVYMYSSSFLLFEGLDNDDDGCWFWL